MDQFDRLDAYHKAHSIREEEEKSMEKNEGSEEPNNNGGLPSTPQTRRRKQYMETSPLPPPQRSWDGLRHGQHSMMVLYNVVASLREIRLL